MSAAHTHRALADCPVCGDRLVTTRLGCAGCGTELVGQFAPCPYCALDDADHELLRVFLTSRGNMKELQAHLGVSYPTARARFNDLLERLGWLGEASTHEDEGETEPTDQDTSESDASHASGNDDDAPDPSPAPNEDADAVRDQVLAQVASGQLSPAVAADLLDQLGR